MSALRPITFGSVCSGVDVASVAWRPRGWNCAFMSEVAPFPRAVLAHRWPEAPLHGDFTTIQSGTYDPIDLLVGGTPCQSFSVNGLRGGLADGRGNLALEYLRLADRLRPRWLVWENVPGVLSSNGGRDFGAILGGMGELGYGFAYRVLDAQFFEVPQVRRRVFVVGHLGDWRAAASVLFERETLSGSARQSREARRFLARMANEGAPSRGLKVVPINADALRGAGTAKTPSTDAAGQVRLRDPGLGIGVAGGPAGTLTAAGPGAVATPDWVRLHTVLECERLQGLPDHYTAVPWVGGTAPDSLRYKAVGNAIAAPVLGWIGQRVDLVDGLSLRRAA